MWWVPSQCSSMKDPGSLFHWGCQQYQSQTSHSFHSRSPCSINWCRPQQLTLQRIASAFVTEIINRHHCNITLGKEDAADLPTPRRRYYCSTLGPKLSVPQSCTCPRPRAKEVPLVFVLQAHVLWLFPVHPCLRHQTYITFKNHQITRKDAREAERHPHTKPYKTLTRWP